LFPALLTLLGGNRKLANKIFGSNNRLPKSPIKLVLLGAIEGKLPLPKVGEGWGEGLLRLILRVCHNGIKVASNPDF
jgi:hypothetical protein